MKKIKITYYVNDNETTLTTDTETFEAESLTNLKKQIKDVERAWKKEHGSVIFLTTNEFEWGNSMIAYRGEGKWEKFPK